jgi:hypothetical protein
MPTQTCRTPAWSRSFARGAACRQVTCRLLTGGGCSFGRATLLPLGEVHQSLVRPRPSQDDSKRLSDYGVNERSRWAAPAPSADLPPPHPTPPHPGHPVTARVVCQPHLPPPPPWPQAAGHPRRGGGRAGQRVRAAAGAAAGAARRRGQAGQPRRPWADQQVGAGAGEPGRQRAAGARPPAGRRTPEGRPFLPPGLAARPRRAPSSSKEQQGAARPPAPPPACSCRSRTARRW